MTTQTTEQRIIRLEEKLAEREILVGRFTAPIVCICGSTKFKQAWISENTRLTKEGNIVLAVGLWGHHERIFPDAETKEQLDNLHKRKIDLCDWVWVLNIGGYIGESTRNEIRYAERLKRPIRYLSKEFPDYKELEDSLQVETAEAIVIEARKILQEHLGFGEDNANIAGGIKILIDQNAIKMQNLRDKHSATLGNIRAILDRKAGGRCPE